MGFAQQITVTIFDSLIIYLTLGAPFAVYHFFQLSRPITARSIGSLAFSFFFWLPSAYHLVRRSLTNSSGVSHFVTRKSSDANIIAVKKNYRSSLERALSESIPDSRRRSFSAVLERYVGLRLAVEDKTTGDRSLALFEVSGHPNPRLAAICVDRLNRIGIERHYRKAQSDLLALIIEIDASKELIVLAAQLARSIGDSYLATLLTANETIEHRHARLSVDNELSIESTRLPAVQPQNPVSMS